MNAAMAYTGIICAIASAIATWLICRPCVKEFERAKIDGRNAAAVNIELRVKAGELESKLKRTETALSLEREARKILKDKCAAHQEQCNKITEVMTHVYPSRIKEAFALMSRRKSKATNGVSARG